jgi:hypothetical protein
VESEEQIRRLIREVPPGRTVTLGISRDGNPMKISVQLADHSTVVAQARPHILVPQTPRVQVFPRNGMDFPFQIQTYSSVLGVQTESLTRQLGEYFGVKDGEGVLVRSVEKGSAAEKAGLKAGDVIIKADNEKLTDRSDLSHILRSHRTGGRHRSGKADRNDRKNRSRRASHARRGDRDAPAHRVIPAKVWARVYGACPVASAATDPISLRANPRSCSVRSSSSWSASQMAFASCRWR